ncbi:MAG TPA: helix-turn-helix transcriptional regulator [Candidatus Elarobacter sp.]|jgi:hypothetical protein|nr:helix-turn-helix transcriptional regulator [Candidatus Elarobacter sp.]
MARLLLAWSQRDLAERAQTAVSTVADFERSARVPIASTLEALEAALVAGGVQFNSSGVMLADTSGHFANLAGGRAIPLIQSDDLSDWAKRYDAPAMLPTLIAMLIRASVGAAAALRFPSDSGVREAGWDGTCVSPVKADFVPSGISCWELSVKAGPKAKAEADYNKRKMEGTAEERATTTYVAVTLRGWPGKEEWAAAHRKDGVFKDVHVLDVHDLVAWLGMHPQVAQWLAVQLGRRSLANVSSIDEGWLRWALTTAPPLTEAVILASRDEEIAAVLGWLKGAASVLNVQAAERDEAIAFLAAVINQLPAALRDTYRTHTLIADTESAAREIAVAMKPQIIVMSADSPGFAESIAHSGHHVYAVHGPDAQLHGGVVLSAVRRVDLADALEVSMGQKGDEARALARRAGGSLPTLRRLLSRSSASVPHWVSATSRTALISAFFAGAWDETAPSDQDVVAAFARRPFRDLDREFSELMGSVDAPLRRSISKVSVVSPQDLWQLIAPSVTEADVTAFFETAESVLRHVDPRFYAADRARVVMLGDRPKAASPELRRGQLEALNVMAAYPERATQVQFLDDRIRDFVRRLLEDADAARWWSLRDELALLAEAAPNEFLSAVEQSVKREDAPIAVLMQSDGHGFFARDYTANLTSAIARLAWLPEYLPDCVAALGALAEKDPKERHNANGPARTLLQIFLLWYPQTYASLDERLDALELLRKHHRDIALDLFIALIPKVGGDAASDSPKPVWRKPAEPEPNALPPVAKRKDVSVIFEWLLEDIGGDLVRWEELLDHLSGLDETRQLRATDAFLVAVRAIDNPADRLRARRVARTVLHRHREFAQAFWAMPESVLTPLQTAFDELAPADIVERDCWVFDSHPQLPDPTPGHDLLIMEADRNAYRQRVARALLESGDLDVIIAMAAKCENPVQLGMALVAVDIEPAMREALFARAARFTDLRVHEFVRGLVQAGLPKYGTAWAASLLRAAIAEDWPSAMLVAILQGMPQNHDTFALMRETDTEIQQTYWRDTPWLWFIHSAGPEIVTAVEAKLKVDAALDAVSLIGQTRPAAFEPMLLLRALWDASKALRERPVDHNSTMIGYYCGLIMDHLIATPSVDASELVKLEWAYFGLFQSTGRDASLLERGLAEHADFFVDVVSTVYRADGEDEETVSEDEVTRRAAVAEQSFMLLDKWSTVPGTEVDGAIDSEKLNRWVDAARARAVTVRRVDIVDQQIGVILSASKAEPNGDWPPKPIRDVLERLRSKEVEIGFEMGTRNRRGPTTRAPLDGGELERNDRRYYDSLAKRFRSGYPRTYNVLKSIANSCKIEAVYMDQLAHAVDRL